MAEKTELPWCDSTINGSSGCDGCELWNDAVKSCYAGNLHETRLYPSFKDTHPELYAPSFDDVRMIPGRFEQAAKWSDLRGTERKAKPWLNGWPRCIFVGDMGDFLSRGVTDEFLKKELLGAITSKPGQRHFWMLLTKRPSRLARLSEEWGGLPDNCIAMTTITTQKTAGVRIPELLKVRCRWLGLSCEPLLGPMDLSKWLSSGKISWVICGGESGPHARPCNGSWIRSIKDQCLAAGVACFVKQMGSDPRVNTHGVVIGDDNWPLTPTKVQIHNAPLHPALKHPKGGDMNEWPSDLRVREFPEVSR